MKMTGKVATLMPTLAWTSQGTIFLINGERFDQVVTVIIDHANRRLRGYAISSSSDVQVSLRDLRRGDVVQVALNTRERTEYLGKAKVVMCRTRVRRDEAISLSFVFDLMEAE